MARFLLTDNPFHVLGVTPRDNLKSIDDAFDDAIARSPSSERLFAECRQSLITPKIRLLAELAWFPGASPSLARQTIAATQSESADVLWSSLENFDDLTKASIAADGCSRFRQVRFVEALLMAHSGIEASAIKGQLLSNRTLSGFTIPTDAQITEALRHLREQHASAALDVIVEQRSPGDILARLERKTPLAIGTIIDELLKKYDHWSSPKLADIHSRIERNAQEILQDHDADEPIFSLLDEWSQLSEPLQVYSTSRGLDEPRSLKVFYLIRASCLSLANDQGEYDLALRICQALRVHFANLPTACELLARDTPTLERLSKESQLLTAVTPYLSAITDIQKDLDGFIWQLIKNGFTRNSGGQPTTLFLAFEQALKSAADMGEGDKPWYPLRDLALEINNTGNSPEAALMLLRGAHSISRPTNPDLIRQLKDDEITLVGNYRWERAQSQLTAGNLSEALATVQTMVADAPDDTKRAELAQLASHIQTRIDQRRIKYIGWGVAAVVVLGLMILGSKDDRPTSTADTIPQVASQTDYSSSAQDTSAGTPDTSSGAQDAKAEEMPPVGDGLGLTLPQVRYCRYTKKRLDILRTLLTDDSDGEKYNALVNDYNSRCAHFKYYQADLDKVTAEVSANADKLNSDAVVIHQSWLNQ